MNLKFLLICFIIRYFYLKNKEQISMKKRYISYRSSRFLNFGNFGLYFNRCSILQFNSFLLIKKIIKIFTKNKYNLRSFFFFWFFLIANFPVSKKSKNSRMGKGKGDFLRWSIKVPNNLIFLEFKTFKSFNFKSIETQLYKNLPKKIKFVKSIVEIEIKSSFILLKYNSSYSFFQNKLNKNKKTISLKNFLYFFLIINFFLKSKFFKNFNLTYFFKKKNSNFKTYLNAPNRHKISLTKLYYLNYWFLMKMTFKMSSVFDKTLNLSYHFFYYQRSLNFYFKFFESYLLILNSKSFKIIYYLNYKNLLKLNI